jgi:hypothetical protein
VCFTNIPSAEPKTLLQEFQSPPESGTFLPWSPISPLIHHPHANAAISRIDKPSTRKIPMAMLAGPTSTATTGATAVRVHSFLGTIAKESWAVTRGAIVGSRAVLVFRTEHKKSGFIVLWGSVRLMRTCRMGMGLLGHLGTRCKLLILGRDMGWV